MIADHRSNIPLMIAKTSTVRDRGSTLQAINAVENSGVLIQYS